MHDRRTTHRVAATLVAILTGLVIAGCGQTSGSPAAAPTPTLTAAEWAEKFCAGVIAAKPEGVNLSAVNRSDPAAVKDALTKQIDSLGNSITKLGEVGPSPIKSGDEGLARTKDAFTKVRDSFSAARDKIAALAPGDTAGVTAAMQTALQQAQDNTKDIGAGLDDTELKAAAANAPTCKANGLA